MACVDVTNINSAGDFASQTVTSPGAVFASRCGLCVTESENVGHHNKTSSNSSLFMLPNYKFSLKNVE